jgi:hypothetical protein
MHWQLVTAEEDTAMIVREEGDMFITSPREEQLSSRAKDQSRKVVKIITLACKSGLVGQGQVRVSASGYAHHDESQMPTDQRDFIAISIGRIG